MSSGFAFAAFIACTSIASSVPNSAYDVLPPSPIPHRIAVGLAQSCSALTPVYSRLTCVSLGCSRSTLSPRVCADVCLAQSLTLC
eukprot:2365428-Rhodomonas_salina.1